MLCIYSPHETNGNVKTIREEGQKEVGKIMEEIRINKKITQQWYDEKGEIRQNEEAVEI